VSLGSSRRDHEAELALGDVTVAVARRGTDGDVEAAFRLIGELDGTVDAIGLGGLDVHVWVGEERFDLADGLRLLGAARRTPVLDGSLLKRSMEPMAVRWLAAHGPLPLPGLPVLMASALDRWGMSEALEAAGCAVTYGDLMLFAGIPYPVAGLAQVRRVARRLAAEMVKLPIHMVYPTGRAQEGDGVCRFPEAFGAADLLAGDFHLLHRDLPARLDGKAVLTNTTTAADRAELAARGARWLFLTTPLVGGRSFGTNAVEAAVVAVLGRAPEAIAPADIEALLTATGYRPAVVDLQAFDGADGAKGEPA
jgi:hypothetical protein